MSNGIRIPEPPFHIRMGEFLSGAGVLLSLIIAFGGLIAWSVHQENRITELEKQHLAMLQKLDDIDTRGTRSQSERFILLNEHFLELQKREDARNSQIEQVAQNLSLRVQQNMDGINKRFQDISERLNGWDSSLRKLDVAVTRQEEVFRHIDSSDKLIDLLGKQAIELAGHTVNDLKNEVALTRSDIKRLDEQQTRILQALDNTYNTLQEALRGGSITRQQSPSGNGNRFPPN